MSFEDQLRSLLRRQEPSPDFARRVLAQIEATPRKAKWYVPLASLLNPLRVRRVAVSAALCALLLIGFLRYRRYERLKAEGELARERVLVALRIAGAKLNVALKQIDRGGGRTPDPARTRPSKKTERL